MSMKCRKCDVELNDGVKFCTNCGAEQDEVKKCRKCGTDVKEGIRFCTECGEKMADDISGDNDSTKPVPMPNFKQFNINPKSRLQMGILIGSCLIVLSLLVYFVGFNHNPSSDAEMTVKVEDMMKDYIRDQATAENKYKNKEMRVTGTLKHKTQFANSQNYALYIYGQSAAGKSYKMVISVAPEDVSMVNKINVGDFVNAEGICVGIVEQEDPTDILVEVSSKQINQ